MALVLIFLLLSHFNAQWVDYAANKSIRSSLQWLKHCADDAKITGWILPEGKYILFLFVTYF